MSSRVKRKDISPIESGNIKRVIGDNTICFNMADEFKSASDSTQMAASSNASEFTLSFIEALKNISVIQQFKGMIGELVTEHTAVLTQRIDDLETEQSQNVTKINNLEEKIDEIESENKKLQLQLDAQEQYSRGNSLRFTTKWIENDGETIAEIKNKIIDCVKLAGVTITQNDIDACHRVGRQSTPKNNPPRSIIVKFVKRQTKYDILTVKQQLKDDKNEKVYAAEDLTQYRAHLATECRKLKKNGRIQETWTSNGNVVVKLNDNNKQFIQDISQLELLK